MLRPGSKPPNRHQIAGDLLNEVYFEEREKAKQSVAVKRGTLSLDGWSTITNTPVIGISFTVEGGESYFAEAIDTTGTPHTSDNLYNLAVSSIESIETHFGVKIVGIVTDGAANMVSMRDCFKLNQTNQRNFFTYGCQSHVLNLFTKELDRLYKDKTSKVCSSLYNNKYFYTNTV